MTGSELMKKSLGVMSWLKASTDAALTLQPASAQVNIPCVTACAWTLRLLATHRV